MAITTYKCPNCGAGIHFKPALQKFHCDYCLSEYTEEEIKALNKDIEKEVEVKAEETLDEPLEQTHLASYNCNSCGAEVVTDDTTTSTFCYYCHNPVILSDRLTGSFQPNKMIPFTIDKDKAKKTFLEWASKNTFVPKEFYSKSQLEKMTGIYLPYWWADYKVDVEYVGQAENIRTWQSGNTQYSETKEYQVVRKGVIDINNVEELAFTKIDENLLNGIAPYNESEAVPFSMPYLSGFFAEQHNISKEEILPKIEEQVDKYTKTLIKDTVNEFNITREQKNEMNVISKKMNYTLLPAWILTYIYNDKTYVFAVNGQTGKSFGELPLNDKKVISVAGAIFAVMFLILLLGGLFIW